MFKCSKSNIREIRRYNPFFRIRSLRQTESITVTVRFENLLMISFRLAQQGATPPDLSIAYYICFPQRRYVPCDIIGSYANMGLATATLGQLRFD